MVRPSIIFVALMVCAVAAQDMRATFAKLTDCWQCTEAGYGWCPIARKCGGFANRDCGEKTDERYYNEATAPAPPPSACTILTDSNFETTVDGSKAALVEFFAPWCGHCKSLKPVYEKVCEGFEGEETVVATLDATAHPQTAQRFSVTGYPTIKFFPKGGDVDDDIRDYEGGREEQNFLDFLNKETGSGVASGGGVTAAAGRDDKMDAMVTAYFDASVPTDAVIGDAEAAASGAELGKYYVSVMKKVEAKGVGHIATSQQRIKRMIGDGASKSMTKKKINEFKKKLNILAVFADAAPGAGKDEL